LLKVIDMSYFLRFPLLRYTSNNTVTITSDVLKRVAVNQKTKENLVLFDEYDIQEGETPETVSYKFYETTDYHWVVLIVNDILDPRYGWPLKGDELYEYTAAKYGSGNVNAVHHYTISETNDIIVDPTQEVVVKTVLTKFPDNLDIIYNYAANGSSTAGLTQGEQSLISYLQQPTSIPLPGTLYRADINHSLTNFPSRFNVTSGDSLSFLRVTTPGWPVGEQTQHVVYNCIKPIVDSSNATLLTYLIATPAPPANTHQELSSYYSNGVYYSINSAWTTTVLEISLGFSVAASTHPPLSSYLREPAQTNYLNGDVLRSSYMSTIKYGGLTSNEAIATNYNNDILSNTSPVYANIVSLLSETSSNANIRPALETTQEQTTTYPYADAFEVTNIAHETNINESKRRIRILKAEYLSAFVTEFERLINV
jgi:hypothetical protein